jgi:hypothetical protein
MAILIGRHNELHLGLHVQRPIFRQILTKFGIYRQILVKVFQYKSHKNPSDGSRADNAERRTDGRTDGHDKVNRRFSRVCEISLKCYQ